MFDLILSQGNVVSSGANGYGDGFGNGDFWGGDGDGDGYGDGCDSYSEPLLEEGALCLI